MRHPTGPLLVTSLMLLGLGRAQDGRLLPDPQTFLARARENLASDDYLQRRYTYKERRTEFSKNPFGRIGTGEARLYEVYPAPEPELTYRRLVWRDGQPVSAEELARQDREQQRKVAEHVRARANESEAERERRLRRAEEARREERRLVEDVLRVFEFKLERRETLSDRPAIVGSFTPRPEARPETREGKLVRHFKGYAWIDEREYQVVKVEAEAIDTINFGWGIIARIHEGTIGTFVRRPVTDGAWLPAESRLVGTGRALLFRKFDLNLITEYFDYRPIDPRSPPRFVDLERGPDR